MITIKMGVCNFTYNQFINVMKLLTKIQNWGDHHHPKWLDFFRLALGIILFWKGISFIGNLSSLTSYLIDSGIDDQIGTSVSINLIAHLIIALHLIGGFCIAIGTHTRLFSLLNLPVLIIAVFFVNLRETLFRPYTELWLSVFVLLALVCFLVEGDGVLFLEHDHRKLA